MHCFPSIEYLSVHRENSTKVLENMYAELTVAGEKNHHYIVYQETLNQRLHALYGTLYM